MKKLLLLLLFLPGFLKAQEYLDTPTIPIDTTLHTILYRDVVSVPGLTKQQIFSSAMGLFRERFDVSHGSISYFDAAAGKLIVRATEFGKQLHGLLRTPFSLTFNIYLWIKDGKYKYQMSEFTVLTGINGELIPQYDSADAYATDPKYKTRKGEYTMAAKEILNVIDGNVQNIIVTLKAAISAKKYAHPIDEDF